MNKSCERIISKDYVQTLYAIYKSPAMDGIVVNKKSLLKNKQYEVIGESKSGDKMPDFKDNQCMLIYGSSITEGSKIIIPKDYEYSRIKKLR